MFSADGKPGFERPTDLGSGKEESLRRTVRARRRVEGQTDRQADRQKELGRYRS